VEARRAGRPDITRGREKGFGQLVERRVLAELGSEPALERPAGVAGRGQRARPQPGRVLGESLVVQKGPDQLFALARAGRFEKVARFGDTRDGTGEFEIGAAKERFVAR